MTQSYKLSWKWYSVLMHVFLPGFGCYLNTMRIEKSCQHFSSKITLKELTWKWVYLIAGLISWLISWLSDWLMADNHICFLASSVSTPLLNSLHFFNLYNKRLGPCMFLCLYVCMFVCLYVRMFVCSYVCPEWAPKPLSRSGWNLAHRGNSARKETYARFFPSLIYI